MLSEEEIEVSVEEEFQGLVNEDWARKIAMQVLKAEGVTPPYEGSLVFTDSETVQQLNRDYRGVDRPTDVLAFDVLSRKEADSAYSLPPDDVHHLGAVSISYP